MSMTNKISTYLPWSGIYEARIMPTEDTFGTPSLQPRCYRTCAPPPAVCLLRLLFTVSRVSICLLVFEFPFLFIWVLVFCGFSFLSFSFSFFKQKSCGCSFCLEHCRLLLTVDALKLFTSAVFLAGQCSAVFSSQYPYF